MAEHKTKLKKKKLALILLLALVPIFSYYYYFSLSNKPQTAYVYKYKGEIFFFRANLTEALKIPVYPDEKAIFDAVMNESVKRINIVFVNSTDNGLVAVNGFEVSSKLSAIFYLNGMAKKIKGLEVSNYSLKGTEDTLIIALIPPVLANKTEVRLEDHVIFISGKTEKEFDLATIKFLLSVMEVVV
jgi:hypothetical protein